MLKKYFRTTLQPLSLLTIEGIQVFEEATLESDIITLQQRALTDSFPVVNLGHNYMVGTSLAVYFELHHFDFKVPEISEWFIGNEQ